MNRLAPRGPGRGQQHDRRVVAVSHRRTPQRRRSSSAATSRDLVRSGVPRDAMPPSAADEARARSQNRRPNPVRLGAPDPIQSHLPCRPTRASHYGSNSGVRSGARQVARDETRNTLPICRTFFADALAGKPDPVRACRGYRETCSTTGTAAALDHRQDRARRLQARRLAGEVHRSRRAGRSPQAGAAAAAYRRSAGSGRRSARA